MNFIYGGVGVLCFVLAILSYKKWRQERENCKFLMEFQGFLQKIQHYYSVHKIADEAVCDAMNESDGLILQEAKKLYQLLGAQQEETRRNYMEQQKNRFFKMLAAVLCIEDSYGSQNMNQDGMFQKSLRFIKQDVTFELWMKQQVLALFAGLEALIVLPGFFLKIIEIWGVSNIPELIRYYHGTYGLLSIGVFCLLIYGTHWSIWQLRCMELELPICHRFLEWLENKEGIKILLDRWEQKNYSTYLSIKKQLKRAGERLSPRQFVIQQFLWAIGSGVFLLIFGLSVMEVGKIEALKNSGIWNPQITQSVKITEKQWKEGILSLSNKYCKEQKLEKQKERMEEEMHSFFQEKSKHMAQAAAIQVMENIQDYQRINQIGILPFLLLAGIITGWRVPIWLLAYRKQIWKMGIQNEILHYETVILMLAETQIAKEMELLEWMEEGSILFRDSLTRCLLESYGGEQKALDTLRKAEPCKDFQRLTENLMVSDQIGIKAAFEGLEQERENRQEKKRQDNEIQVRKRVVLGQVIAFVPLTAIIGLYLIIPFVMESMAQLSVFMEQMK